jgi:hypothetical protein
MRRIAPVLIICVAALVPANCGEDNKGIYGSQCDIISCAFDTIECQLYPDPYHSIVIHYLHILEEGGQEWTAKIVIDLADIDKVEGLRLEDEDFINRVQLTRPGSAEQWPDFSGNFCEISSGGDQADRGMSGKCAFAFDNGYFATAEFSCTLEAVP